MTTRAEGEAGMAPPPAPLPPRPNAPAQRRRWSGALPSQAPGAAPGGSWINKSREEQDPSAVPQLGTAHVSGHVLTEHHNTAESIVS